MYHTAGGYTLIHDKKRKVVWYTVKLEQIRTTSAVVQTEVKDARSLFDQPIVITGTTSQPQGVALDDDSVLGFFVCRCISDHYVPVHQLHTLWTGHGLDPKYLPSNPPSKEDAFSKAVEVFEEKGRRSTLPIVELHNQWFTNDRGEEICLNGLYRVRLLVRPVTNNREEIVRHIIREIVDEKGKTLVHGRVATLTWKKKMQEAIVRIDDRVEPDLLPHLTAAEREFRRMFTLYSTHYDANTVRSAIARLFADLNAIPIVRRGPLFVPRNHKDKVDGLERFVDDLAPYAARSSEPPQLEAVTVANADKERQTVFDAFMRETLREMDEAIGMIERARENGEELDESLKRLPEKLNQRINQYKELLDINLDILELQLKQLQAKLSE